MEYRNLHPWNVTPKEAIEIQKVLRSHLILDKAPEKADLIAGVDVSADRGSNLLFAAVVVLDSRQKAADTFQVSEVATASEMTPFPYIPGLLSFREIPVVLKAWEKLKIRPDCLVCDGQGIAHPRRIGIASHLGLVVDTPSIGCGKTRLIGLHQAPGPGRGDRAPLIDRQEVIGAVLRTKEKVAPLYVSQGHRMTLDRAVEILLSCQTRYRLPEPTRIAHNLVNQFRRAA